MKIRVIVPFMDKQFNNEITRVVGDIIDIDDAGFKCDEELAKDRIAKGYCEIIEDTQSTVTIKNDIPTTKGIDIVTTYNKPAKKGKKASKKR